MSNCAHENSFIVQGEGGRRRKLCAYCLWDMDLKESDINKGKKPAEPAARIVPYNQETVLLLRMKDLSAWEIDVVKSFGTRRNALSDAQLNLWSKIVLKYYPDIDDNFLSKNKPLLMPPDTDECPF